MSIKHFKPIIFGCKLIVETDHANLLFPKGATKSRIQRWMLLLSEHEITLIHRPGNSITWWTFFQEFVICAVTRQIKKIQFYKGLMTI